MLHVTNFLDPYMYTSDLNTSDATLPDIGAVEQTLGLSAYPHDTVYVSPYAIRDALLPLVSAQAKIIGAQSGMFADNLWELLLRGPEVAAAAEVAMIGARKSSYSTMVYQLNKCRRWANHDVAVGRFWALFMWARKDFAMFSETGEFIGRPQERAPHRKDVLEALATYAQSFYLPTTHIVKYDKKAQDVLFKAGDALATDGDERKVLLYADVDSSVLPSVSDKTDFAATCAVLANRLGDRLTIALRAPNCLAFRCMYNMQPTAGRTVTVTDLPSGKILLTLA